MITINSEYKGDLRTEAIHLGSGNKIITDAPLDNNGRGEAFSPTDLVCASLCSCMMTIMGIKANQSALILDGLRADITKIMTSNPRKIAEIKIVFQIDNTNATPDQLSALKKAALTCPVALSLHPDIKQEVEFSF